MKDTLKWTTFSLLVAGAIVLLVLFVLPPVIIVAFVLWAKYIDGWRGPGLHHFVRVGTTWRQIAG